MGRSVKTQAVVLRSIRLGEADRVLHLSTLDRGRVGAVAKGIRKTSSRFGARLEPLSQVDLMLHQGSGELLTVTGVELTQSHHLVREDGYRLNVGLIGAEAMLRLFSEQEANAKAFGALTKFLDLLDEAQPGRAGRPALDPLGLAFQLKLLWLAGYLPHLGSCAECGGPPPFAGYSARSVGVVCTGCAGQALPLSAAGLLGMDGLLRSPLSAAPEVALGERGARECLAVVRASYEEHGGFRLKTLSA
ncbi:MAG: repair protein RecO [Gaiellaceae bacterium]|nr:repair protein RecO [Gaiellaceae bacterium]